MRYDNLVEEAGQLIRKLSGERSVSAEDVQRIFNIWERMYGEKIVCTTCAQVVRETFAKIKEWYARMEKPVPDAPTAFDLDPDLEGRKVYDKDGYAGTVYTRKKDKKK